MKFIMKQLILLFLISALPHAILFSQKAKITEEKINFEGRSTARSLEMIDALDDSSISCKENVSISATNAYTIQFPEQWILDSALDNAPQLLLGIVTYLKLRASMCRHRDVELADSITISSYHRFILVGPSGSGKTTLAYAIAKSLGYDVAYLAATSFLGEYRNQTGINISRTLTELTAHQHRVVIIIDELHKLFEHHTNDHTDDSQTAAAFWLTLDEIQKHNPHAIIIGTANNVDKLPPEIKSRFVGKIIAIPMPNKKQKINALKEMLSNDKSIVVEEPLDKLFLQNITDQMYHCSLRDLQLLIDTTKIIYYAENFRDCELEYRKSHYISDHVFKNTVVLTKKHFQQALDQLKVELLLTKESLFDSDKFTKKLQNWSTVLSMATNIISLAYWGNYFINYSFNQASY